MILELAEGVDLASFGRLIDPKLKYDENPKVFTKGFEMEQFLRMIARQLVEGL